MTALFFYFIYTLFSLVLAGNLIKDYRPYLFSFHPITEGFYEVDLFSEEQKLGTIPLSYIYLPTENTNLKYRYFFQNYFTKKDQIY